MKTIFVRRRKGGMDGALVGVLLGFALIFVLMPMGRASEIAPRDQFYPGILSNSIGTHYVELPQEDPEPETEQECIERYVDDICELYDAIDPAIVKAIIWQESRFEPTCVGDGGYSIGLMQVSTRWHMERAYSLGVTDLSDPYGNILVGVDYLNDLLKNNDDLGLALMLYNMNHRDAYNLYKSGKLSSYARTVLAKAEEYREEV